MNNFDLGFIIGVLATAAVIVVGKLTQNIVRRIKRKKAAYHQVSSLDHSKYVNDGEF